MSLAYAECPLDVRESLTAQYFVDAIRDEDTQNSTRLMDAQDLKSALSYETVTDFSSQVSQKGVHVATALFDLEREDIPVRVLNLNSKPKILDKGDVIVTCEPVLDIVVRSQELSGEQHLPLTLENLEGLDE
ncbi:hypothetical protein AVEN_129137-1 [Araneus ventricosus]|uniref:Uncharacterized protein n=1 Tax=Araneus ventricosus TaxID=182803 RepID=A0A4Y2RVG1_ARAVE|nr:hypothetical protein AVEN_129137-1 [Araneus ventricosus]